MLLNLKAFSTSGAGGLWLPASPPFSFPFLFLASPFSFVSFLFHHSAHLRSIFFTLFFQGCVMLSGVDPVVLAFFIAFLGHFVFHLASQNRAVGGLLPPAEASLHGGGDWEKLKSSVPPSSSCSFWVAPVGFGRISLLWLVEINVLLAVVVAFGVVVYCLYVMNLVVVVSMKPFPMASLFMYFCLGILFSSVGFMFVLISAGPVVLRTCWSLRSLLLVFSFRL